MAREITTKEKVKQLACCGATIYIKSKQEIQMFDGELDINGQKITFTGGSMPASQMAIPFKAVLKWPDQRIEQNKELIDAVYDDLKNRYPDKFK